MATFGNTTDGANVQTQSADRKYAYKAQPASSGKVTAGTARVWLSGAGTSSSRLVIYSDNAGAINALLAYSDNVDITGTSEAAVDYTFSGANQINIVSGTDYWIGIHFSDPGTPNFTISRSNTAGLVRSSLDTYSDGPSDLFASTTNSNGPLDIFITYVPTAALTGTVTSSITGADIVTGGKTIILTLTGDTFIAAGTGPIGTIANTQALIDGIDSAQAEATGWDAVVKAGIDMADVVRTSATVVTITLDAEATYNITATETITATIPAEVLTGAAQIVASPTFTVSAGASTNMQINIGDTWKAVTGLQINIGDTWKTVTKVEINIGDVWKTVFG